LSIDCGCCSFDGETSSKPCGTGDVKALFSHLADATTDNLLDRSGIDTSALDKRALDLAEKRSGMHPCKTAITATDWATNRIDNDDFASVIGC
jgi:hypothetical protein